MLGFEANSVGHEQSWVGAGTMLDRRYQVERRLASGTWAHVYRAHDTMSGRAVAIKMLRPERARESGVGGRFLEEGRLCARLTHPCVTRVLGRGWSEDALPFLVLTLVDGLSLEELVDRDGPLPWPRVMRLAAQLLGALAHVHDRGIVHRDLTPANVVVATSHHQAERAVLIDFGFAEAMDLSRSSAGVAMGSPATMAPEQWLGRPVDQRTDLYALGCVLYTALTGRAPFPPRTDGEPWVVRCMTAHLREPVAPIAAICAAIPQGFADLVMALLEKDPLRRPQAARSALRRLAWVA
ncbi:MAG: serine/threonine-protein kinase [Myxococcota bacterium]